MIYGLDDFTFKSPLLKNQLIVLEQTENSDLIQVAKPCNKEFFEKVFSSTGPFWLAYKELGLGQTPFGADYLAFVNERMFFCKNLEKEFLYSVGPKKNYFLRQGKLAENLVFSFDNVMLFLSIPFDFAKQVSSIALAALKINEELENFEKFSIHTKKFWLENREKSFENHAILASKALEGAVLAMKYSFFSSLAYSLKIKLKNSPAWLDCELENFSKLVNPINSNKLEKVKQEFGFYSVNPYDISLPRFSETQSRIFGLGSLKWPKSGAARWRENAKFLCARYLAMQRSIYLDFAKKTGLGENVFFLNSSELSTSAKNLEELSEKRKNFFLEILNEFPPKKIFFDKKWVFGENPGETRIFGFPAGGLQTVQGQVIIINTEQDYNKNADGKIVLSKTLSPNLTVFYGKIKAIVSEGGGKVAHAAIVAIEQNIPCIVQAKNTHLIKEGDEIKVNGLTGKIELLKKPG